MSWYEAVFVYLVWALCAVVLICLVFGLVARAHAQNVGRISAGRLAWYDYSCKCPVAQLTCAECWRYLRTPAGSRIDPDPTGASDGILWTAPLLPAPGTNPAPNDLSFKRSDFRITPKTDGTREVSVIWGKSFEGNVACPEYTLDLFGMTEKPLIFWIFRNGFLQHSSEWELISNPTAGGGWLIRTMKQAACPFDRFVVVYLLESDFAPVLSP